MNSRVTAVLQEYQSLLDREYDLVLSFDMDEYLRRRDEFLLGVGAAVGKFLNLLIKAKRPKVILEAGTSYGYSTLYLAEAAHAVGATVISLELASNKVDFAREMLTRAGLQNSVEFLIGDALETIPRLDRQIDFCLIDLWKDLYIPTFDRLYPKLADRAIITADNVLAPPLHAEAGARYIAHIRTHAGIDTVTVPIGSGIELSYFTRDQQ